VCVLLAVERKNGRGKREEAPTNLTAVEPPGEVIGGGSTRLNCTVL
jgi:hypothetical protein